MKKFFLTICLCLFFLGYSQGENDNWYFGAGAAVNFANPSLPTALIDSQMPLTSTCATVSDNNGKLLFYTDGKKVYDRDHQIMQNGVMLPGQAWYAMIAQNPANSNQYYLFIVRNINSMSNILTYSIIDISQGNLGLDNLPLGSVLNNYKDIVLYNNYQILNSTPAITIVKHANGQSFWLVTHNETKLYSYLVSTNGINSTPIQSTLNFGNPTSQYNYFTNMKVSPPINSANFSNYLFLNMANPYSTSKVLSFNNLTGMLTNDYELSISSVFPVFAEFNVDSSLLYITRNGDSKVFIFDIMNSVSTPIYQQIYNNMDPSFECAGLQRNKYGDIYLNFYNYGYLSKIINQNSYTNSSVDLNNLFLASKKTYMNLPQSVPVFFASQCINNENLTNVETYSNHLYQVSNNITTQNNYAISSGKNITMKAGNSIDLKPNTHIMSGATFLAKIEACGSAAKQDIKEYTYPSKISLEIELDKDILKKDDVTIYPNPTSDILNIKSDSKINAVSVVDLTGRKLDVKLEGNRVDVQNLPSGTYLINIETKDGVSTEKFIKK